MMEGFLLSLSLIALRSISIAHKLTQFNNSLSDLLFLIFSIKTVSLESFCSHKSPKHCVFKVLLTVIYLLLSFKLFLFYCSLYTKVFKLNTFISLSVGEIV